MWISRGWRLGALSGAGYLAAVLGSLALPAAPGGRTPTHVVAGIERHHDGILTGAAIREVALILFAVFALWLVVTLRRARRRGAVRVVAAVAAASAVASLLSDVLLTLAVRAADAGRPDAVVADRVELALRLRSIVLAIGLATLVIAAVYARPLYRRTVGQLAILLAQRTAPGLSP